MQDINLARLDSLAKLAVLGEWTTVRGDGQMDEKAKYPTEDEVLIFAEDDCEIHPIADFSCNHTCRLSFQTEATAQFVAELVSAWPAIRERLSKSD